MGRLKRCMLPTDNKNLSFSDAISENTNVVFFLFFLFYLGLKMNVTLRNNDYQTVLKCLTKDCVVPSKDY